MKKQTTLYPNCAIKSPERALEEAALYAALKKKKEVQITTDHLNDLVIEKTQTDDLDRKGNTA